MKLIIQFNAIQGGQMIIENEEVGSDMFDDLRCPYAIGDQEWQIGRFVGNCERDVLTNARVIFDDEDRSHTRVFSSVKR